ncbi:MAG TPA: penicillin-binding protein [Jatrophihabitans sp.]|nr:penicillin-binding protein [Jatrophihabitans sp.]
MAVDPTRPDPAVTIVKLVGVLVAVGVLAAGVLLPYVGGLGFVAGKAAGNFLETSCHYHDSPPPQPTTIYARDGRTVIARLFTQDRVPIPLSEVPKSLQEALIATEDRNFYEHHGVDFNALVRSAISTGSGDTQGGSTLTMQYVKQVRYYQAGDDKQKQEAAVAVNLHRKMEDAKCALYIEGTLHKSKDQILQDYLNIAFFGEHSYGIQTAAETYFNKPARALSLAESALLVGLLRAPSAYDPFVNPAAAKERRNEVLQNLVDVGKLSQAAADKVEATPVALATQAPPLVRQGCANANSTVPNAAFFCEYVVSWLEDDAKIPQSELETGGLKVVTTLNPSLQTRTQQRMNTFVPAKSPMTAVLPIVDPHSGDILAMAASKTYGTGRGQTEQQIFTRETAFGASTFKLFPLLAALSTGVPSDWELTTVGSTGSWKPKNCATTGRGVVNGDSNVAYSDTESLATATAKSSNTYFVGLADELLDCNLQPIIDLATKLGVDSLKAPETRDLTVGQAIVQQQRAQQLVLGQGLPVSPLQLAGAYAMVANGGRYNTPTPVLSIEDSRGNAKPVSRPNAVQVVLPQVAAQAVQLLSGDTRYPGTSASVFSSWYGLNPSVIAGKTGTNVSTRTGKNASIWFVGMTPRLVGAAGVVDFDNTSKPSRGLVGQGVGTAYGDFAAKVWLNALRPSLAHRSWTWPDPNTMGTTVPSLTGMTVSQARSTLSQYGFKMTRFGAADGIAVLCPSSEPYNTVAYYGPQRAASGATITVCTSSQEPQFVYHPPPPPPPPQHHGGGHGGGGGGGGGAGGGGGGGGGGTPPGPGGGGGGGHGHGPGGGGG